MITIAVDAIAEFCCVRPDRTGLDLGGLVRMFALATSPTDSIVVLDPRLLPQPVLVSMPPTPGRRSVRSPPSLAHIHFTKLKLTGFMPTMRRAGLRARSRLHAAKQSGVQHQ